MNRISSQAFSFSLPLSFAHTTTAISSTIVASLESKASFVIPVVGMCMCGL